MTGTPDETAVPDPGDVTIATYQARAQRYAEQTANPSAALIEFHDRFAALVGTGARVLELGSGPGHGASYLESRGVQVDRTDATPAFVEMLRASGHAARLLDARFDELGGPYDAILADAVLLHLGRDQLEQLLVRARHAVTTNGVLAATLKEGDGAAWSNARLGRLRHFTYWREPALRELLTRTGWTVISLDHVQGAVDPWLYLLARVG